MDTHSLSALVHQSPALYGSNPTLNNDFNIFVPFVTLSEKHMQRDLHDRELKTWCLIKQNSHCTATQSVDLLTLFTPVNSCCQRQYVGLCQVTSLGHSVLSELFLLSVQLQ